MSAVRRVGLLFGGRSAEHEVSLVSARAVAAAVAQSALECVPLAVDTDGCWLPPERSREILEGDAKRVEARRDPDGARLAAVPGGGGLLLVDPAAGSRPVQLDVVFPLIHGWGGEDGRLQGLLELAGLPYVGSGVAASAVGMDKVLSKKLLQAEGIDVCPWLAFGHEAYCDGTARAHERILSELGFPVFVKPANGGSSLGISRVTTADGLPAAMKLAFDHDQQVVVERGIDAREIECAVLGNERPEASGLGEIIPAGEFYDYASKYEDPTSRLCIPAQVDAALEMRMRDVAVAGYRAHDLRGFARVDFLVERGTDRIFLSEVNTLPGFTSISMFPKLWEARGLSFPRLVERLVELALPRG